jgi:cation:H+ antiporter
VFTTLLALVACLAVLLWAADLTASSGARVATRWGVSSLVIGLTLTSVGTSLPELATNVAAGLQGTLGADASGLALGNVIGSNLALLTLLLGASALVHPILTPRGLVRREGGVLLAMFVLAGLLGADGRLGPRDGAVLLTGYAAYVGLLLRSEFRREAEHGSDADEDAPHEPPDDDAPSPTPWDPAPEPEDVPSSSPIGAEDPPPWREPLLLFGGITLVTASAFGLVHFGTALATRLGVPEVVIGLGVGVGTSLPELAVTVRAARDDAALALGNLLGSAIANTGMVLGAGALIHPLVVEPSALSFDGAFMLATSLIALLLLGEERVLARAEGGVLLILFALYTWLRIGAA